VLPYFPPAGTTFVVNDNRGRALGLENGWLKMRKLDPIQNLSYHWECVERDGWLGVRYAKTGMYLGHDGGSGIVARADHYQAWEYIALRAYGDMGYQILTRYWDKLLAVVNDGWGGVRRDEYGGLVFEFQRV
jgi:hypothetical protein